MNPIRNLINQLSRLPGIGLKTAERLAYYIIDMEDDRVDQLVNAIKEAKDRSLLCSKCHNITDKDPCHICSDESRDKNTLAVVEYPKDVQSIEEAGGYKGIYFVLHGDIVSSVDGDQMIQDLIKRVEDDNIEEVILALSPDVSGEASILYLSKILEPYDVELTRIAYGIPYGGDMDFFDRETINIAIENRRKVEDN